MCGLYGFSNDVQQPYCVLFPSEAVEVIRRFSPIQLSFFPKTSTETAKDGSRAQRGSEKQLRSSTPVSPIQNKLETATPKPSQNQLEAFHTTPQPPNPRRNAPPAATKNKQAGVLPLNKMLSPLSTNAYPISFPHKVLSPLPLSIQMLSPFSVSNTQILFPPPLSTTHSLSSLVFSPRQSVAFRRCGTRGTSGVQGDSRSHTHTLACANAATGQYGRVSCLLSYCLEGPPVSPSTL